VTVRTRRRVALGAAVLAFLLVSAILARWLSAEGAERAKVERLLDAQARGDTGAMAREIDGCDAGCRNDLQVLAAELRGPGEVEVVRYDSGTSHSLGSATEPTRVVWRRGDGLPTVQCVDVRRKGNVLTGPRVTLLALSRPIGRESSC
jgi:hypothetical protein